MQTPSRSNLTRCDVVKSKSTLNFFLNVTIKPTFYLIIVAVRSGASSCFLFHFASMRDYCRQGSITESMCQMGDETPHDQPCTYLTHSTRVFSPLHILAVRTRSAFTSSPRLDTLPFPMGHTLKTYPRVRQGIQSILS